VVCEAFSLGVFASHGESRVANQASVICPAAAFGEATEIFYNLEGSSRKANFAVTPPSGIRTVAGIFAAWKSFLSLEGSIKLVSVSDVTFAYRPTVTRLVVREHLRFGLRSLFAAVGSEFTYSSHPVLRASRPMALAAARFENLVSNFS
jgi:NADH dehydrogenase/NADH:ubiquinone oxidoreductase subunit G